jgi:hypothetical protein
MRAWIPLDLRNVDKVEALRNQLRRLNDFMADLAASLAPSSLTPQQPDSNTIFNDFLQQITITGGDAKNLIFFDDFMYDPQADPAPSASGVWRTGSQGGGGSWLTHEGNLDLSALGVHQFASQTTLGDAVSIHMWARNVPTKPITLVPGLEIGFRVRRDSVDFTRATFAISISDGFSADVSTTKALRFVIRKSDDNFRGDAALGNDGIYFEIVDTAQSPQYQTLKADVSGSIVEFVNVKMIINAGSVDCFLGGVAVGSLSGVQMPSTTTKLNIQIFQATFGTTPPGATQKSYIDRFYIDASRIDRGAN